MSAAVDLLCWVLGDGETPVHPDIARDVLDDALAREVDPLRYCASSLGINETLVMQRAARWADLAFHETVPRGLERQIDPDRLDALSEMRSFGLVVLGRPVVFSAPDFTRVLRLAEQRRLNPDLRDKICLVPDTALRDFVSRCAAKALIDSARQRLARRWPYASAHLELTRAARLAFIAALVLLVALVLVAPYHFQYLLLPLVIVLLLAPSIIRLAALGTRPRAGAPPQRPDDAELPVYSVLVPLRDEAQMVPQLFAALRNLDYPPERLDIVFVVEETSPETVAAVTERLGDPRFSLVRVPDAAPRTKPKALDYALPLCRGEFVVVFDAEDVPDPAQLWKAALRFRDAPELVCLQARLEIDNGRSSWLATMFAGEYAGLFGVLLPALARWRLPMPLGGTSNHFRISVLREVGGWDAYNVTEDADLGLRLARRRLAVDVLDSCTVESAPTRFVPWLGQRTRWLKGWMQTFIVHNRNPRRLARETGFGPALAFEILALGMITGPLLHVGFVLVFAAGLVTGHLPIPAHPGWSAFYGGVLVLGYGSALALNLAGLKRLGRRELMAPQALLPFYWIIVALAMLRAAVDLARRPYFWFKTPHRPAGRDTLPKRLQLSNRPIRWPLASK
ncbi:glycosyltransferase [Devosia albogilva]|uniref:Glycosyltransferase n=1 Tax=Devosia albogilva TaxID=429726 RepID=A0ABW5QM73_9HYPH